MTPRSGATPPDVPVIGGGQAGLAMGYHLTQRGLSFQIVDAGAEIGETSRSRWDSLLLASEAHSTTTQPRAPANGRIQPCATGP